MGLATSIGRYFGSRSRRNSPANGEDDMSVGSQRSLGGRLFGGKKRHQLLGDDDSIDSETPF